MARAYLFMSGVAVACLLGAGTPAFADDMGVMDRARPDYDAKGLPMGGFRLYPTMDLSVSSDDNVYRTEGDKKGDIFYRISPHALLQSQWSRHLLEIYGGADVYRYSKLNKESRTDWDVGAKSQVDIVRGAHINSDISYLATHEPRTSPDQPGLAASPTPYSLLHADASVEDQPNRFGVTVGANLDRYNFQSTPLVGGGALNNADRDRVAYEGFGKVAYEFSPGYAAFVRGTYDTRVFDLKIDRTGVDRDSHGYRIDSGLEMMVSHLMKGEIFVGYLDQTYKAPLNDIAGIDYGASLIWYASPLITLHVNASRKLNDTTITSASASDDRYVAAGFDYELRRNIIVQGEVGYTDSNFFGSLRDDKVTDGVIDARYLINRYMSMTAKYEYSTRTSTVPGHNFNDNTIMGGLRLQM